MDSVSDMKDNLEVSNSANKDINQPENTKPPGKHDMDVDKLSHFHQSSLSALEPVRTNNNNDVNEKASCQHNQVPDNEIKDVGKMISPHQV